VIRIDKLYFEADKAVIKESSYPVLDQIATLLKKRSDLTVEIGGHTNGLPNDEFCHALSKMRAENVYYFLISKGVPKERL
ncbi:MAG: OmpA family protein, partial [Phaeodactylibacter sp.]|nr:OmpA family protein [Phaeodactylibacter sp.]